MSFPLLDSINMGTTQNLGDVFNQPSPYKYPALIICCDEKQEYKNNGIYSFYMDNRPVMINGCQEVFNTRNLSSASELQAGYARNIDLDSELKHINYYEDKSFHNNRKIDPNSISDKCNGLARHARELVIDYRPVGARPEICVDNYPGNPTNLAGTPTFTNNTLINTTINSTNCQSALKPKCSNTAPDSRGFSGNTQSRYIFDQSLVSSHGNCINKFQTFEVSQDKPNIAGSKYTNNQMRDVFLIAHMQRDPRYARNQPTYYKFHGGMMNPNCKTPLYTNERLFNNTTKRSMLPNFQNIADINPEYIR